jgi:hypothetical protein
MTFLDFSVSYMFGAILTRPRQVFIPLENKISQIGGCLVFLNEVNKLYSKTVKINKW